MESEKKGGWYDRLIGKVQSVIMKYGLPEDIAADIRALTVEIAKEQFKAGNRSGIAWARTTPPKTQSAGAY